jgi:hypothetical protein
VKVTGVCKFIFWNNSLKFFLASLYLL